MKRIGISFLSVLVLTLLLAGQSSAISIYFDTPSATFITAGNSFTVDLRLDTEGETQITSLFTSVFADPALFAFVGGTSPGNILFNASTLEGVQKVSDPITIFSDPAGLIRAANFATALPGGTGIASTNQLLATLTFQAIGGGVGGLNSLIASGDDVTVATNSVAGSVTLGSSQLITVVPVPEPGTALLMGLGLFGLAASGRRA